MRYVSVDFADLNNEDNNMILVTICTKTKLVNVMEYVTKNDKATITDVTKSGDEKWKVKLDFSSNFYMESFLHKYDKDFILTANARMDEYEAATSKQVVFSTFHYSLIQPFGPMIMNAEESVGNIRNLLLNLNMDTTDAFFRTSNDSVVDEIEKKPSEMSAFLASNYDDDERLYISFHPMASYLDVIIHTYKR